MSKDIIKKELTTIEINGMKFAVDLSTAKQVYEYKVGDSVKVLTKKWNDNFEVHPGVITGFDIFNDKPGINVAYIDGNNLVFKTVVGDSKDLQLAPMMNAADVQLERSMVVQELEDNIRRCERELQVARNKLIYFEKHFDKMFSGIVKDDNDE